MPISYAHSYRESYANPYADINPNTDGHGTTYRDSHPYIDTNANGHPNPDCDSHRYTYCHAGPDRTQRAWLQRAGFTNGGPFMGRGTFKQH